VARTCKGKGRGGEKEGEGTGGIHEFACAGLTSEEKEGEGRRKGEKGESELAAQRGTTSRSSPLEELPPGKKKGGKKRKKRGSTRSSTAGLAARYRLSSSSACQAGKGEGGGGERGEGAPDNEGIPPYRSPFLKRGERKKRDREEIDLACL